MQTGALEIFDGVFGVFDDAAEAFVGVGDVVAAVEIVVDVDLPIAIERIAASLVEFQLGETERPGAREIARRAELATGAFLRAYAVPD